MLTLLLLGQQPENRAGPGSPMGEPEDTNSVAISFELGSRISVQDLAFGTWRLVVKHLSKEILSLCYIFS